MKKLVRWMDMTPEEFIEIRREKPVAYVPYGHAEAHGVYNALGMDWYSADCFCERAADRFGGICAPGLMFHADEEPGQNWGINTCRMGEQFCSGITNSLLFHNMLYHLRLMDARGFKVAMLVGGHCAPKLETDVEKLIEFYRLKTGTPMQAEYRVYIRYCRDAFQQIMGDRLDKKFNAHAGMMETSVLMAYKPRLAHPELLGTDARYPLSGGGVEGEFDAYCAPYGFCKDPKQIKPSPEIGERFIDLYLTGFGKRVEELLAAYDDEPLAKERPTAPDYNELEEMWQEFYSLTHKYWLSSLSYADRDAGKLPPPYPTWEELGIIKKK